MTSINKTVRAKNRHGKSDTIVEKLDECEQLQKNIDYLITNVKSLMAASKNFKTEDLTDFRLIIRDEEKALIDDGQDSDGYKPTRKKFDQKMMKELENLRGLELHIREVWNLVHM